MSALEAVNPPELGRPRGYSNGMKGAGQTLFVAGQIGWDGAQRMVPGGMLPQFARSLDNVLTVVRAAGGAPESVARLTIYVTDKQAYRALQAELGAVWRERFGRHYPAMALLEIKALLEDDALVEIEATAIL